MGISGQTKVSIVHHFHLVLLRIPERNYFFPGWNETAKTNLMLYEKTRIKVSKRVPIVFG